MTSTKELLGKAKSAYRACAHLELILSRSGCRMNWVTDFDPIADALGEVMYPEQFATSWEKSLYEALEEVVEDLDLKSFPRPHIEKMLRDFAKEQQRRQDVRAKWRHFRKRGNNEEQCI